MPMNIENLKIKNLRTTAPVPVANPNKQHHPSLLSGSRCTRVSTKHKKYQPHRERRANQSNPAVYVLAVLLRPIVSDGYVQVLGPCPRNAGSARSSWDGWVTWLSPHSLLTQSLTRIPYRITYISGRWEGGEASSTRLLRHRYSPLTWSVDHDSAPARPPPGYLQPTPNLWGISYSTIAWKVNCLGHCLLFFSYIYECDYHLWLFH